MSTDEEYDIFWERWNNSLTALVNTSFEQKFFLIKSTYLLNLILWDETPHNLRQTICLRLCECLDVSYECLLKIIKLDKVLLDYSVPVEHESSPDEISSLLIDIILVFPEPEGPIILDWIRGCFRDFPLFCNYKVLELIESNLVHLSFSNSKSYL